MKLEEFIKKYKIDPVKFALECDCRPTSMYCYMRGTRKPLQDRAEKIEAKSDGLVTVFELRGKDERSHA